MTTAHVFDAAQILGIGTPSTDPLNGPTDGFVTIRIPEGLSLQALRESPAGQTLMHAQDWYDKYQWGTEAPPAGVYRLRIPVPGSNRKTVSEQAALLAEGETLAPPVALVVAALLCIAVQGDSDPLDGDWTRCAEKAAGGYRVVLAWSDGRLSVGDSWYDFRGSGVWAASARTSF